MPRETPQYRGRILETVNPPEFSSQLKITLREYYPDKTAVEDPVWGHPADQFVSEVLAEARGACSMLFHLHADITKGQTREEAHNLSRSLRRASTTLAKVPPDFNYLRAHADRADIEKKLEDIFHKLSNISPALDRLLADEPNPLMCADLLRDLLNTFRKATDISTNSCSKPKNVLTPTVCAVQLNICATQLEKMMKVVNEITPKIEQCPKAIRPDEKRHNIAVDMGIRVLRVLKQYDIYPSEYASAYHDNCQSDAVSILCAIGDDIGLELTPITWRDIIGNSKKAAPDLKK